MEVHAHSHTPRKKWTHYLWEFLLLFLAVFCGFLAEYQLEHKIEKDRSKELASSFYTELSADSVAVSRAINFSFKKDSALQYLKDYFRDSSLLQVSKNFALNFYTGLQLNRSIIFEPRGAILGQLINSGSLRYFKSKELQQLTIDLAVAIKNVEARNERVLQFIANHIDAIIIKHTDEQWNEKLNALGGNRSSIIENLIKYRDSSLVIPYHFMKPETIDKIEYINLFGTLQTIVRSNAIFQYISYQNLNTKILQALRKVYHIE